MATVVAIPPITIEQYLGFEGYPGLRDELINGRIVLSPQPKPNHQQVVENVYLALREALLGSGFVVKQNTNIKFETANSMPGPDVFVVSKSAWSEAVATAVYLSEPPLIVVEVLSPANRRRNIEQKARIYLGNGVKQLWTIDPKRQTVHAISLLQNGVLNRNPVDFIDVIEPILASIPGVKIFDMDAS